MTEHDRDLRVPLGDTADDRPRGRASVPEPGDEGIHVLGSHGDQEAAGGLGVEGEFERGRVGRRLDPEPAVEELAVGLAGPGEVRAGRPAARPPR